MNQSRRELNRLVALGSAVAVIGIPIALVASTWQPLEPVPRTGDQEGEPDDGQSEESPNRNRRGRQDRDGENDIRSTPPPDLPSP